MAIDLNIITAPHPQVIKDTDSIDELLSTFSRNIEHSVKAEIVRVNDAALDRMVKAHEHTLYLLEFLKIYYRKRVYNCLSDKSQNIIKNVRQLVNDLVSGKSPDTLENSIKKIEEEIVAKWWIPRVRGIEPRFVVLNPDQIIKKRLTIYGDFAYAETSGCTPIFKFKKIDYQPELCTCKALTFLIDFLPKIKDQHEMTYLSGELKVIWKKGKTSWETSIYHVLFGCLSNYPGRIRTLFIKADHVKKTVSTNLIKFDSQDNWRQEQISLQASSGCQLIPDTSTLQWIRKKGRIGHALISDDSSEVRYDYRGQRASGILQVSVEESTSTKALRVEEINNLAWGKKISITPRVDEKIYCLILETFTGDTFKFFPHADNFNPLIKFTEASENGFILEAISPEAVSIIGVEELTKQVSKEALELFAVQAASRK